MYNLIVFILLVLAVLASFTFSFSSGELKMLKIRKVSGKLPTFLTWMAEAFATPKMPKTPSIGQDAATSVEESAWFWAAPNWGLVSSFCRKWQGKRRYHCVDVFSASGSFCRRFQEDGYEAVAYDIKSDSTSDITTRSGFLKLLDLGMANLFSI